MVPPSLMRISSLNVTIPAEDTVIASAAEATPIVPPSLILISSLKVTIPPEEICMASVALAEPISPSSGTTKLPPDTAPVVVIVDEPLLIVPNPLVIEPESRAPVVTILLEPAIAEKVLPSAVPFSVIASASSVPCI